MWHHLGSTVASPCLTHRPQNYYCIHIDQDAPSTMFDAVRAVASCLTGVFLSPQRIHVKWSEYSVLEADLICMAQLWNYPDWKYLINLTGSWSCMHAFLPDYLPACQLLSHLSVYLQPACFAVCFLPSCHLSHCLSVCLPTSLFAYLSNSQLN